MRRDGGWAGVAITGSGSAGDVFGERKTHAKPIRTIQGESQILTV